MLRSLYIRDYALIEELSVDFSGGLNILTGETGAGKSIIIGALKLLLGGRASPEMVRTGARKAVVEAHFEIAASADTQRLVAAHGLSHEDDREGSLPVEDMIVRREITARASRAFVNDTPVLLGLLKSITETCVDLHGQHDQQSLLRPEVHRAVVDAYGQLEDEAAEVASLHADWRSATRQLEEIDSVALARQQQADLHAFQLQEIDEVSPKPEEEEALHHDHNVLANAAELRASAVGLEASLYSSGDSVYDALSAAAAALERLSSMDDTLGPLVAELRSARLSVEEIASSLREYGDQIEDDPERLAQVQDRLGAFEMLKQKYGGTIAAVLDYRSEIAETPTREGLSAQRAELAKRVERLVREVREAAAKLSGRRKETAAVLEPLIKDTLQRLGMEKAAFEVRVSTAELTSTGSDTVEFHFSPNPGEPPRPLARCASGGEISRIMLALKAIIAKRVSVPVLVFDEIDVGISGAVAQRVGEEMHALARSHQVVSITHLPQIAAQGDAHFVVEKTEVGGRTVSDIRPLSDEERAAQIARLISGARVTDSAIASARELINSALTQ